jgi:cellulose synthase/poly-beta-1,6-N-acetylglucosamine synthase-like glycosyltransferase
VGQALLIVALAWLAWTFVGFPLVLWVRARSAARPCHREAILPEVSLVICAHDEAGQIGAKLDNLMALDYPRDKLEIVVASDGSTDATVDLVRARQHPDIRILDLPRQGKIPTLNAAIREVRGEIVVFSDANSLYTPGALRALVAPFADTEVGGVAGNQCYAATTSVQDDSHGERTYWSLDRALKDWQSRAGSVTSSTGAIHAVRRELLDVVPSGVTDDFWISTGVVARGYRLVFEADAVAMEPPTQSAERELDRKVRIMTRGLRAVWLRRELLNPFRFGFYAIQLLSHKLLRRLAFIPLLALLAASLLLWNAGMPFRLLALVQIAGYTSALLGRFLPSGIPGAKLLTLPYYFVLMNAAAVQASWNVIRGRQIERWDPQREPS